MMHKTSCEKCGLEIQDGVRGCTSAYETENCIWYWKHQLKSLELKAFQIQMKRDAIEQAKELRAAKDTIANLKFENEELTSDFNEISRRK